MHTLTTVHDLLTFRASDAPTRQAFEFLADRSDGRAIWTYAELDRRARTIAVALRHRHPRGERALLLYAPGVDYIAAFFGCLYAGIIAVPGYPPQPGGQRSRESFERVRAIRDACDARIVLTTAMIHGITQAMGGAAKLLPGTDWIATDTIDESLASEWRDPGTGPGDLAFLQYTSGSTGSPKGVMVTHANLLENFRQIQRGMGISASTRGVSWLPPYHDMGLIGGILTPIYAGCSMTLMSPLSFIQRPSLWLETISRVHATHSGGPDFAFRLATHKPPSNLEELDLGSWEVAFSGAEPVRAATLQAFARTFAPAGFRATAFVPCYGLAEATLYVTGCSAAVTVPTLDVSAHELGRGRAVKGEGEATTLVSSGWVVPDHELRIVDPDTCRELGERTIGEIWVRGPSIAQGYWNLPELTERTFHGTLAPGGEGPFLRTGDLGFVHEGAVFVSGRIKDLIIVRGRNHYPQDLEATAQASHPSLRPGAGAAVSIEIAGEERVALVQEIRGKSSDEELQAIAAAVRAAVAEQHGLGLATIALIRPGTLPKTSSGKIQRFAAREHLRAGTLALVYTSTVDDEGVGDRAPSEASAPGIASDPTTLPDLAGLRDLEGPAREERLVAYLRAVVASALRLPGRAIAHDTPLLSLGLDSLAAMELKGRIEGDTGVEVPYSRLLEGATIGTLARSIAAEVDLTRPEDTRELSNDPHAPVTPGQRAQWFLQRLAPDNIAYTIAVALRLHGSPDRAALLRAFERLVVRHDALRSTIEVRDGQEILVVHDALPPDVRVIETTHATDADVLARAREDASVPFDLARGPLVRLRLYTRERGEDVLAFAVHHVAVDYWSLALLVDELAESFAAEIEHRPFALAPPRWTFAAYARELAKKLTSPAFVRHREYWTEALAGAETKLELPTDRPRPPVQSHRGASRTVVLEADLVERVRRFAADHGVTTFATLLASYQALLHRMSGQDDVLVGMPAMNRDRSDALGIVGLFTNPLVMRARFDDTPSFSALAQRAHESVARGLEHQAYPFAALVEHLQPVRDPSRSPLFQAMIVYQPTARRPGDPMAALALGPGAGTVQIGPVAVDVLPLGHEGAQFDVSLALVDRGDSIGVTLQWNADLFEDDTGHRMLLHFQRLLEAGVAEPGTRVAALELLSAAEREHLLAALRGPTVTRHGPDTIHALVEAQVDRTPDAIAVEFEGRTLGYAELDRAANRVAHRLRARGLAAGAFVGVLAERSLELVVALLGVLKAGAAYVPLEPSLPHERLAGMIEDAGLTEVLTVPALGDRVRAFDLEPTFIADGDGPTTRPDVRVSAMDVAYAIFTSGSTGRPKAAMNEHGAVVHRLSWMRDDYGFGPADVVLQKTPFGFDVSVWEFFLPLACGARLVVARPGGHQDPAYLRDLIAASGATAMHFVPSMLDVFLAQPGLERCRSLTRVFASGEALSYALQERFHAAFACPLHNLYGPTEAAVDVTAWTCERGGARTTVPIGRAVANTSLYVVSSAGTLVPFGVKGELYLGGVQVGRGYLGRPELTRERFVPDPFSDRPGARMYRTGDLVCARPDGTVEYFGRLDHQVKIRGVRIELGEIEATLRSHPGVRECVTTTHARSGSDTVIVAYVVRTGEPMTDEGELRAFAAERLPGVMVPDAIVFVDALPLSPNGKVDRRALPAPVLKDAPVGAAPRTALERTLARLLTERLGLPVVDTRTPFFDMGAHSLHIARLQAHLEEELGVAIPLVDLFRHATIERLAQHLAAPASQTANADAQTRAAARRKAAAGRARGAR